jgi:tetratricopeptide (TPR) repeat protein
MALDGLVHAREQSQPETEGKFQNVLAMWAEEVGDPIAGLEACREELVIMQNLGNQVGQARALINLGDVLLVLGDNQQGRVELERGLRKSRATGGRRAECVALNNLSLVAIRLGDDTQAWALARLALDIGVEIQGPDQVANAQVRLGNAALALGRNSDARVAFGEAYAIASKMGHARQHDAACGLARVALLCDEVPQALHAIKGLLALLDTPGGLNGVEAPRLARLTCYRVLECTGDPLAAEILAGAYDELQTSAANISATEMRHNFLNNIPEHQEITTTWAAKQTPALRSAMASASVFRPGAKGSHRSLPK